MSSEGAQNPTSTSPSRRLSRVRKPAGDLYLSGLTSLSDAAAESLSGHEGSLSLDLDALPESSAEILRQHPSFQDG